MSLKCIIIKSSGTQVTKKLVYSLMRINMPLPTKHGAEVLSTNFTMILGIHLKTETHKYGLVAVQSFLCG